MSTETLTIFPEQIVAGTQIDYRATPSGFLPSGGWALKLYLKGGSFASPSSLTKDFTPDADSFLIQLTAAETGALSDGNYHWEQRATKVTQVERVDSGVVRVFPDIATASAASLLTENAKKLAYVRAAIAIRTNDGTSDIIEEYAIGARRFLKLDFEKLLSIEARLARLVKMEANPGSFGPTVNIRFPNVGAEPWPQGS